MSGKFWLMGGVGVTVAVIGGGLLVPRLIGAQANAVNVSEDIAEPVIIAQAAVPQTKAAPIRRTVSGDKLDSANPSFVAPPLTPIAVPDSFDAFGEPTPVLPAPVDVAVDAAAVDPAPLRRQLRELLEEKLELLTVAQLQVEIQRTEQQIRELQANDRLEELRHELDVLSRRYPQTWGGTAAQQLFSVPLPQHDPLEHGRPSQPIPVYFPADASPFNPGLQPPPYSPPQPVRRRSS